MKREVYKRVDVGYILNSIEPEVNYPPTPEAMGWASKEQSNDRT